jgi:hypothetical protein
MEVFNFLQSIQLITIQLILAKVFFLVVSLLFTIFLVVVLRQVISMQTIINDTNDSFVLKSVALALLIISLSLFLTALVIL